MIFLRGWKSGWENTEGYHMLHPGLGADCPRPLRLWKAVCSARLFTDMIHTVWWGHRPPWLLFSQGYWREGFQTSMNGSTPHHHQHESQIFIFQVTPNKSVNSQGPSVPHTQICRKLTFTSKWCFEISWVQGDLVNVRFRDRFLVSSVQNIIITISWIYFSYFCCCLLVSLSCFIFICVL